MRNSFSLISAFFLPLVCILIVLTSGCRTLKPVVKEVEISGKELYDNIVKNSPEFDTYSAGRVSVQVKEGDDIVSFRANVRIRRDSAFLASISAFAGIEIARIVLTRDSVKVLDRVNNNYFKGNYKQASRFYPYILPYEVFEFIFTGSPVAFMDEDWPEFSPDVSYIFKEEKISISAGDIQLENNIYLGGKRKLRFAFDHNYLANRIEISGEGDMYGRIDFRRYGNYDGVFLPEEIELYFISHNVPLVADITIGRIETGKSVSFPFSVPSRFREIK